MPRLLLLLLIVACFGTIPCPQLQAQVHFTDCATGSPFNATVIIPDDVSTDIGGESLALGDEIAVFTPEDFCAGVAVWDGTTKALTVFEDDEFTAEKDGFAEGEPLSFRIWDASREVEVGEGSETIEATYADPGGFITYNTDGLYANGDFYEVSALVLLGALPVELTSFEALRDGESVLLSWQTATELNNAGFEIQQLKPGDDSVYVQIAFVEGSGTTEEERAYRYRVEVHEVGLHRFRLRQIDHDGHFEYSPEVEVTIEQVAAYKLGSAYPNPFNPTTQFSLSVRDKQQIMIAVYDLLGRKVTTLYDGILEAQRAHLFRFDAAGMPSGMYFIRAVGETFSVVDQIMLLK